MTKRVCSNGGMTVTEKLKYLEKFLSQCQFLHHKSHKDCLGTEPANSLRPYTYPLIMALHPCWCLCPALALCIWTCITTDPLRPYACPMHMALHHWWPAETQHLPSVQDHSWLLTLSDSILGLCIWVCITDHPFRPLFVPLCGNPTTQFQPHWPKTRTNGSFHLLLLNPVTILWCLQVPSKCL